MSSIAFFMNVLRILIGVDLVLIGVFVEAGEQHGISLNFQQNDYKLTPERAEVVRYDNKYMKQFEIKTFKYNRTTTAFNVTVNYKFDVDNHVEIVVQSYKFASNEYRVFPLRFEFNMCAALKEDAFGLGKQFVCGNFTGCPFKKNQPSYLCNWTIDPSKFPPLIPTGRYMVEAQGFYLSTEIFFTRSYAEVARPFV